MAKSRTRPSAAVGRWLRRRSTRDTAAAVLFVGPNLVAYTLFVLVPVITGVVLGFYQWNLFDTPTFVGLENYTRIAEDPLAVTALWNTVLFLVFGVFPTIIIGFLFASLINVDRTGVGTIRVLYFVPLVVSAPVSAVLWTWLYRSEGGIVNSVLGLVGIEGPSWMISTTWALPAMTVMLVWMSLPLVVILYLAALQRVPAMLYEAAQLDGAGVWVRLWRITWPQVGTMTLLVFALQVVNFLSAPLEVSLIMTDRKSVV